MAEGFDAATTALDLKHHHFALSVPDLQQAIDWYGRVLGFEPEFTLDVPGAEIAVMRRGDLRVEFLKAEGAQPMHADRRDPQLDIKTLGHKHVCFAVRDVPAAVAALKARGVDIAMEMETAVYIRDVFGNLVEFTIAPDLWR